MAWAAYFMGEIVVLAALWWAGEIGYDLGSPSIQVNDWRAVPLVLTVMVVLGLAALGGGVLVRARRGSLRRSWWIASASAGLLAIGGGLAMSSRASGYCYTQRSTVAPFFNVVRKPCHAPKVDAFFSDYIAFYQRLSWVVISAGITMLFVSGLIWFIHGRSGKSPEPASKPTIEGSHSADMPTP